MKGTLYLVATPIGNFDDITFRALKILKNADIIVCEEMREGKRLLSHFGIDCAKVEYLNEHNEAEASEAVVRYLKEGENIALISDSGTPLFSDPGKILVRRAIESDIDIVPVPGPCSIIPALVISGFQIDEFLFHGFLSPKGEIRKNELQGLKNEKRTIVFMETPYRLVPLLRDLSEIFGNERELCIAFNLTMNDEQIFRGTAAGLFDRFKNNKIKGEFVVVMEGSRKRKRG